VVEVRVSEAMLHCLIVFSTGDEKGRTCVTQAMRGISL
jgi:hypothetical protein